jgi:hypothetical protein
MFALVEIVKEKLFAFVQADGSDVFYQSFEYWQDVSWLYNFFKANPGALNYYGLGQKTAIRSIITESEAFFDDILNIAEGKSDAESLDNIIIYYPPQ